MQPHFRSGPQRGMTLIELLVSLTIGLLVTVAAASVYMVARQGFSTSDDQSRTFEAGRVVVDQLSRNIRMAGATRFDPLVLSVNTGVVPNFAGNPIFGVDGGGTAPDSFAIAYVNNEPYFAHTLTGSDCQGANVGGVGVVLVNSFFITPAGQLACAGSIDGAGVGATAAALTAAATAFTAGTVPPLIDQVVDMQVVYGMASTTAPGSANLFVPASGVVAAGGWAAVRSVEICVEVVALAANTIQGQTPGTNCSGVAFPVDNRLHRLFRFMVNRRNGTTGNILPGMV